MSTPHWAGLVPRVLANAPTAGEIYYDLVAQVELPRRSGTSATGGRNGARWFLPSFRTQRLVRRVALRPSRLPGIDRYVAGAVLGKSPALISGLAGAARASPFLRWFFKLPNVLYDHNLGWLLGRRMLRLPHVGRRSGLEYHTVHRELGQDEAFAVIAEYERRNRAVQPRSPASS